MKNRGNVFIWILFFIIAGLTVVFLPGCAIKPKYLIEESLQAEAEEAVKHRQEEWNWKNRNRLRQDRDHWEERVELLPPIPGAHKKQPIVRKRQYRNPQLGIARNRFNNNAKRRKHITPKKHNGVKIHKKNYWSKTTKDPKEDSK